ncbi:DUF2141 domain-containing protein [Spirosoma rigui]|uniref:DUF2141 domain-containing protein n=1 Tax=Spirosoma rigui TaxID=564064 RepID=UPI0009AF5C49|nr:DUF2141 domain-containing protein [Spirosoma rigui]
MQNLFKVAAVTALFVAATARPTLAQTATTSTTVSTAGPHSLTIVVSSLSKRTGTIRVGLANSTETFDGESYRTKVATVPASGDLVITFDSLPAGRYAVRLYQDLNGNEKIDFNGAMPAEPFGFSNVTMLMGPPSFGQCAFDLAENKRIPVSLMEM